MIKELVLAGFTSKKEEYIQLLNRISDEVNGILEGIKDFEESSHSTNKSEQNSCLQSLGWLIDRFPAHYFTDLKKSFYLRKNKLLWNIEADTRNALLSLQMQVQDLLNTKNRINNLSGEKSFIDLSEKLATLTKKVQRFYQKFRIATQAIFIIPLVLSFFLGLHYRFGDGFAKLSEDIHWPAAAYQKDGLSQDKYVFTDVYSNHFWNEFSRLYFFKPNNFKDLYFSHEELERYEQAMGRTGRLKVVLPGASETNKERTQEDFWDDRTFHSKVDSFLINSFRAKLVFKNSNATKPVLIYKIATEVEQVEVSPFPWHNLIVTAEMTFSSGRWDNKEDNEINTSRPWIEFGSYGGIGPVIDLSWKAELENVLENMTGSIAILHNTSRDFGLNDFYMIGAFQDSLDGGLYLEGISPPDGDTLNIAAFEAAGGGYWYKYDERFFRYNSVWYEIISTTKRLCEITACSDRLAVSYVYHSLKGESYSDSAFFSLKDSTYYIDKEYLHISDPREVLAVYQVVSPQVSAFWNFIEKLVGEPEYLYKPQGVDLLIDTLEIDLDFAKEKSLSHNIDVILNPAGWVVAYLVLHDLNNGIYKVDFLINEESISNFMFEYLKPNDFKFDYFDVAWLKEELDYHKKISKKEFKTLTSK